MSENMLISHKPLLPAVKKLNDTEHFAIVEYEKVDAVHYAFSYSFDDDYNFRMFETEQTENKTEFIEAEFKDDIPESEKDYYALSAASGILTGLLSTVHLKETQLKAIDKFKQNDWKPLVVFGAHLAGYKQNDYKGASKFLVTRAVRTIEKNGKTKEYLSIIAEHPSVAGLLFSVITQYNANLIVLNETGVISKRKLPNYYVIGETNAEKIVCAVFYWLFSLAADEALSRRHILDDLGISKELLKKIKEFANIPFMKNIPTNYEEAEKAFSEWLEKTIKGAELYSAESTKTSKAQPLFDMMRLVLNMAEDSFPVLINEGIVRSMYMLLRVCHIVKEKKIKSFEELMDIPAMEIIPADGKKLSRMCMIASASFVSANIAGATLKAIKNSKVNGKTFSETFFSELNVAGIGRFLFACASDSRYWGEDIRILLQKVKKPKASKTLQEDQPIENISAFESLLLDAVQARILYCLEGIAVRYDIEQTQKPRVAEKKRLWLDTWKKLILDGVGTSPELANRYFVEDEDILYDGFYQLAKDKNNWRWLYLLIQELALFRPYVSLGCADDKKFKGLKNEADYLSDHFMRRQTVATPNQIEEIVKTYDKYHGYVSGKTQNKVIGAGIAAVATVATGGLALSFAPGIAAAIAGEAVVGLHGIALTNASLAFVGGGSLAAGGLGVVGGTAIITGGGALIGLASSGTVSAATVILRTPSEYWVRQGSKLLTYCKCVLLEYLKDKDSVIAILQQVGKAVGETEHELKEIKAEKNDLDKELVKKTDEYLKCLRRCQSELQKLSK